MSIFQEDRLPKCKGCGVLLTNLNMDSVHKDYHYRCVIAAGLSDLFKDLAELKRYTHNQIAASARLN